MVKPRNDQLVEKLWPDFVGRSEGIPIWKLKGLGAFFDPDDILSLLRFDDHRFLGGDSNYIVDSRDLRFWNSPSNANQSGRGNLTLYPSLWPALPGMCFSQAGTNLVENPSFEIDVTTFWVGTSNCAKNQNNGWQVRGGFCCDMICNGAGNAIIRTAVGVAAVPVNPNTDYEYSAYYSLYNAIAAAATINIYVTWYTAAGVAIGSTVFDTNANPNDTGGQRLAGVETSPATAAFAALVLQVTNPANGDTIYWDAIQFRESSYVTPYIDGDLGEGYSWTGTPHATTSNRVQNALQSNANVHIFNDRSEWTVAMWLQMPRDYDDPWPQANNAFFDISDGTNNNRVFCIWDSTNQQFRVYINNGYRLLADYTFEAGDWIHFVATLDFSNDEYNVYLDGILIDSDTTALAAPTGLTQWDYGANYTEGNQSDFVIAEAGIIARAITNIEVANIFGMRRPIIDPGAYDKQLPCGIVVSKAVSQAIATATNTDIAFDTVDYNEHMVFDAATGYVYITEPGWYIMQGGLAWASDAAGFRRIQIAGSHMGGNTNFALHSTNAINGQVTYQTTFSIDYLIPGDFIRMRAYQTSGGNLNALSADRYANYMRVVKIRNMFEEVH